MRYKGIHSLRSQSMVNVVTTKPDCPLRDAGGVRRFRVGRIQKPERTADTRVEAIVRLAR